MPPKNPSTPALDVALTMRLVRSVWTANNLVERRLRAQHPLFAGTYADLAVRQAAQESRERSSASSDRHEGSRRAVRAADGRSHAGRASARVQGGAAMSAWNYADGALFDERDESRNTDARLDESTCQECGEPLEPGERELCPPCRIYCNGLDDDDDAN